MVCIGGKIWKTITIYIVIGEIQVCYQALWPCIYCSAWIWFCYILLESIMKMIINVFFSQLLLFSAFSLCFELFSEILIQCVLIELPCLHSFIPAMTTVKSSISVCHLWCPPLNNNPHLCGWVHERFWFSPYWWKPCLDVDRTTVTPPQPSTSAGVPETVFDGYVYMRQQDIFNCRLGFCSMETHDCRWDPSTATGSVEKLIDSADHNIFPI